MQFRGWTPLRPIAFSHALGLLQAMIGVDVQLLLNLPGYFFDCNFAARLERVETLDGAGGAVLIVFGASHGVALDPAEVTPFLAGSRRRGGQWLEFHLGDRARLAIEPLGRIGPAPV